MSTQTNTSGLRTFHTTVYAGALHPELFELLARRVVRSGPYEVEAWVMDGAHAVRFGLGRFCCAEVVKLDDDDVMPSAGLVETIPCASEAEFEHKFRGEGVTYLTTVQTEHLSENLYAATLEEMEDYVAEVGALRTRWRNGAGECLSLLDIECLSSEAQVHGFHLIAQGGLVLRSQTIFEREKPE